MFCKMEVKYKMLIKKIKITFFCTKNIFIPICVRICIRMSFEKLGAQNNRLGIKIF